MTTVSTDLHELIFEVFDGELGFGAREVRLSEDEAEALRRTCPAVRLTPLPYSGGGKTWYEMNFN